MMFSVHVQHVEDMCGKSQQVILGIISQMVDGMTSLTSLKTKFAFRHL